MIAALAADLEFIKQWLKRGGNADAYWPVPPLLAEIQDAECGLGLEFTPELYCYLLSGVLPYWLVYKGDWECMEFDWMVRDYASNLELFGLSSPHSHQWQNDWLPLLSNNGGDYLCLALTTGKILRSRQFDSNILEVSNSLTDFFSDLRLDIENGLYIWTDEGEIIYSGPPLEL